MFSYSINSLIVFHEVVKSGSFSRAAESLFMTQPGVSNHIAQLEAQAGNALLRREKGKLQLTQEGRIVFKYAAKIEKAARELENTIKNIQKNAKPLLRIGTTATYSRSIMPLILGDFQKIYPQIMIKLDIGSSKEIEKTLFSLQNDIVIVANPTVSRKLYAVPFIKEELVLITPTNHPLSTRETVSLRELKDYPLIIREEGSASRRIVLSKLQSMNITPSVLFEAKSTEFIKEWVSQGKGISILVRRAVLNEEKRSLKIIPLQPPLFLEISILSLKSMKYNSWVQKFLNFIKEPALPTTYQ